MNNIALGQYVDGKSIIHRLDPRTKLMSLILLMVAVFLVPKPQANPYGKYVSFIMLGGFLLLILLIVLITKISVVKYLQSLKQLIFLFVFTFVIQILTPQGENILTPNVNLNISIVGILVIIIWITLFIVFRKHIRAKLFLFIILACLSVYMLTFDLGYSFTTVPLKLYEDGLYFDSQEVLIIEDDEGLKTFVTIINKTMTEPLFVKYSDDSEKYETFIADGDYSGIFAKLRSQPQSGHEDRQILWRKRGGAHPPESLPSGGGYRRYRLQNRR